MKVVITVDEFKEYFARDFVYGETTDEVMDPDITKAIAEADAIFNYDLYPSPTLNDVQKIALLYLVAHFLFINIDTSETGGQAQFNVSSKSANGVSVSFDIPEWCKKGSFGIFATSAYGVKFLIMSKPYLDGVVLTVGGLTQY